MWEREKSLDRQSAPLLKLKKEIAGRSKKKKRERKKNWKVSFSEAKWTHMVFSVGCYRDHALFPTGGIIDENAQIMGSAGTVYYTREESIYIYTYVRSKSLYNKMKEVSPQSETCSKQPLQYSIYGSWERGGLK